MKRRHVQCLLSAAAFLVFSATPVSADVVRFHYTPAPCSGHTTLRVSPDGASGVWRPWAFGLRRAKWYCQPKATHVVTFRHPATRQHISVPIAFPAGTPRVTYTANSVFYWYSLYRIRVQFLRDGSVDVIYNGGLFRPPF